MFERICIPPIEPDGRQFDLGLLAESLVFYGDVHLILREPSLDGLLQQMDPDLVLELAEEGYLRFHYLEHTLGAITTNDGTPHALYDVGLIQGKGRDLESVAHKAFTQRVGKSGRGRRLANRFCKSTESVRYPDGITTTVTNDMQDGHYLESFLRRRLAHASAGELAQSAKALHYKFTLLPGRGFQLHTTLDNVQGAHAVLGDLVNPASVLAAYGTTIADMSLWARLGAEAALNPRQADVLTSRVDGLLAQRLKNEERLSTFQDFVYDDARSIREAINSGGVDFRDVLPVIKKGKNFHKWLSNQPPDANLIKAYHREVTADSWADRLPIKAARWSIFTGAGLGLDGLVGPAAGIALGAFDSFILDKIIGGWKPNHFIEGPLKDLVSRAPKSQ
jgi:hypothetical protein